MKPFLILQLRPEDAAADDEFAAFLRFGKLNIDQVYRIRMEKEGVPNVDLDRYSGVILGGGPFNVSEKQKSAVQQRFESDLHDLLDDIIDRDHPFFGACYGIGFLANHLGAPVSKDKYSEGVEAVTISLTAEGAQDQLASNTPSSFRAFAGHKEAVQELPKGATLLASSESCPIHWMKYKQNIYASQFHPEANNATFELRVNIYRHAGYFEPEEADDLIEAIWKEKVTEPVKILGNFVSNYRQPA